eukprot:GFKZ01006812.1.p1 GENE.GFKZ01006812.1~~GFKZ01006812.1.p1  ORF type:complete len:742 (-),score=118.56 GFKZ01006812.1:1383-3608(-)
MSPTFLGQPPRSPNSSASTASELVVTAPIRPMPHPPAPNPPLSSPSPPIFTRPVAIDGHTLRRPDVFYIGLNKRGQASVAHQIVENGGKVSQTPGQAGSHIICLVDANARPARDSREVYSVDYIVDCVKQRARLDLTKYRLFPPRTPGPSRLSNSKKRLRKPRSPKKKTFDARKDGPTPDAWTEQEDRVLAELCHNADRVAREKNGEPELRWSLPFWKSIVEANPILSKRSAEQCRERAWLQQISGTPLPGHVARSGPAPDDQHDGDGGASLRKAPKSPNNLPTKGSSRESVMLSNGVARPNVERVIKTDDARDEQVESAATSPMKKQNASRGRKREGTTLRSSAKKKKKGRGGSAAYVDSNNINKEGGEATSGINLISSEEQKEEGGDGEKDTTNTKVAFSARENEDSDGGEKEAAGVQPIYPVGNNGGKGNTAVVKPVYSGRDNNDSNDDTPGAEAVCSVREEDDRNDLDAGTTVVKRAYPEREDGARDDSEKRAIAVKRSYHDGEEDQKDGNENGAAVVRRTDRGKEDIGRDNDESSRAVVKPTYHVGADDESDYEGRNTNDVKAVYAARENENIDDSRSPTTGVKSVRSARQNDESDDGVEPTTAVSPTNIVRQNKGSDDGDEGITAVNPVSSAKKKAEKKTRGRENLHRPKQKARMGKNLQSRRAKQAPSPPPQPRRKPLFKRQPQNSKQERIFAVVQHLAEFASVSQRRAFRALRQERGNWDKAAGLLTRARGRK